MFPVHMFLVLPVLAHIASSDHPQLQQVNNVAVLDLLDQYVLHVEEQSNLLDLHKEWEVDSTSRRRRDVSTSLGTSSDAKWTHSECLEEEDCRIKLSWRMEGNQHIVMLLEAATRGAVGLGWSPGGGMVGADMVLCWVDDLTGKPSLLDLHGTDRNGAPEKDEEQNYLLLEAQQNNTHTVLKIGRDLDTCDHLHDVILGSDTVRVIWSLYLEDPPLDGSTWQYHGKEGRGSRSLHLLSPPGISKPSHDHGVLHWDVTLSHFEIPENMNTLYWCKIFKVPPLRGKHHMIGYEPLIQRGNEGFVHHMLLYECVEAPESTILFESYVSHRGTACYGPNMPAIWEKCLTPVLAWAIGSQGEMFPSHVGLPLAEDHRSTFFMLETHYDNPMFRSAVDSSGVRVFYSNKLREYDGGMLVSGITVTPLHVIPPRQPQYHTVGYCNSLCTQRMFPQTGIKVVSVLLHSHLAGRKMKLRHIRDKQELSLIAQDDNYDFNYQQSRTLQTEVLVLPGDELITECAYQTLNRTDPTLGGYSTRQEMCLAFLLYYPRTSMASCLSMTPVKYFFETFGVKKFYNITMDAVERMFLKLGPSDNEQLNEQVRLLTYSTSTTSTSPSFPVRGDDMDQDVNNQAIYTLQQMKDFSEDLGPGVGGGSLLAQLVIKEPKEFCDKTFMSHLHELPWEEQLLTHRIEDTLMRGQHMVFCRRWDDELVIPAMFSMFPNITKSQDMTSCQSCCKDRSQQVNTATQLATLSSLTVLLYCCILLLQSRRDCYSP